MRRDKFSRQNLIAYSLGIIPSVWLALLIAPTLGHGLYDALAGMAEALNKPFNITWYEGSFKAALIGVMSYLVILAVYFSSAKNYRRREEHGSAKWGSPSLVNKKYADKCPTENKSLTQNVSIGLDGHKHRRNLNVLVCGGSGSGKTRYFAKPNIMNANTSYMILDPNGEAYIRIKTHNGLLY